MRINRYFLPLLIAFLSAGLVYAQMSNRRDNLKQYETSWQKQLEGRADQSDVNAKELDAKARYIQESLLEVSRQQKSPETSQRLLELRGELAQAEADAAHAGHREWGIALHSAEQAGTGGGEQSR